MEISSTTLAARELALKNGSIGRDQEQRIVEEQERASRAEQEEKQEKVRTVEADKQRTIDIYA